LAELFRSQNLVVRRVGSRGGLLVVTFGSYTNEATLDRSGFGEDFLRREQIDAIHVIPRENRWYQHPEMREALTAIAEAARSYDRVLTYGSSMGAYGALRFAHACGAQAAIALSPQYSVDPAVVPFENRWQPDVAKTHFAEPPFAPAPHQYIFYDPRMTLDAQHFALYAAAGPTTAIPMPFAGHPVGGLLVETGALQAAIRAIAADRFDPGEVRALVRAGRRQSQHQYYLLGRRAMARRPPLALALLRKAADIEPESHITSALAITLDRLGRHDEALGMHRAAVQRTTTNARAWMAYAAHLEATGDAKQAAQALRNALPGQPQSVRVQVRVHQVRLALRQARLGLIDRGLERLITRIETSPYRAAIMRGVGRRVG